jgi:1-deoxy-D-xylulose-5-phosphate reductoisomerase
VDFDSIQVVVQPQSLIHSMIQFKDGAVMAQLGTPDMKLPIQYALTYPHRRYLSGERVDFEKLSQINFQIPDMENFTGLKMAYEAGRMGGVMPTVFNAANEMAVGRFLDKKIGFLDITDSIQYALSKVKNIENPDLLKILDTEKYVYELLEEYFEKH